MSAFISEVLVLPRRADASSDDVFASATAVLTGGLSALDFPENLSGPR